jgi:hypothetical protein
LHLKEWLFDGLQDVRVSAQQLNSFHVVLPQQKALTVGESVIAENATDSVRLCSVSCCEMFGGMRKPPNTDALFTHLGCKKIADRAAQKLHIK